MQDDSQSGDGCITSSGDSMREPKFDACAWLRLNATSIDTEGTVFVKSISMLHTRLVVSGLLTSGGRTVYGCYAQKHENNIVSAN